MKLVFTVILISLFFSSILPQNRTAVSKTMPKFRGVEWGASIDKVKSTEREKYLQDYSGYGLKAVCYMGSIAGLDARIDYNFKDGKLFAGTYTLSPGSSFLSDFKELRSFLIQKYGKPDMKFGPGIDSSTVWIKENNYGRYRGPELYWKFKNGFVGLHSSRFKNDNTISILFVEGKTVEEFYNESLVPSE